jgi:hypothetical protein
MEINTMQVQVKTACNIVYDASAVDAYTGDPAIAEREILCLLDSGVRQRIGDGFLTAGMGDVEVEDHDFAVNVQRYHHSDALYATVLLNVTYDLLDHDSSKFDYHRQLEYIFSHMAGEGSMSGETDLIVDDWKFAPHGVEVSIVNLGRTPKELPDATSSDPLYVIGIATAMREVADLQSYRAEQGLDTSVRMTDDEAFNLYQRIVEHSNAGDDGFEIEEVHIYDQYREQDGVELSCDEILMTIHDQSVGVQQAIGSALKLAHEGLVDATIEGELDSDANTWDLKEMVRRGAALQAPEHQDDPLAVSNGSNAAPTVR